VSIGTDPNEKRPIEGNANAQFMKATLTRPNIVAGDYSYYDAREGEAFEERVLYDCEILGDRLVIRKFCGYDFHDLSSTLKERAVSEVHAVLGQAAFEEAWERERAMPFKQAVECALKVDEA
jgi:hypothetical protein